MGAVVGSVQQKAIASAGALVAGSGERAGLFFIFRSVGRYIDTV